MSGQLALLLWGLAFVPPAAAVLLPPSSASQRHDRRVVTRHVLDFEGLAPGAVVTSLPTPWGPVAVSGRHPAAPDADAAVVFDSQLPSGGDLDLGTPHGDFGGPGVGRGGARGAVFSNAQPRGHLLIVSESLTDADGDELVDDPDDTDLPGATLEFDFAALGLVTMHAVTIVDVELDRPAATVELFGPRGQSLGLVSLPQVGDNGVAVVALGDLPGVRRIVVTLNGSAAIDDLTFTVSTAIVGGMVFCDLDGDGLPDRDEPGLPNVLVVLLCGDFGAVRFTGPDGRFLFTEVPPGSCQLTLDEATLPVGKVPGVCPTALSLELVAGQLLLDAGFCAESQAPVR